MVNPNYKEINAARQTGDPDSVFSYYKKLIQLRKEQEIIVYGSYELLLPEHGQIYAYLRKLGEERLLVVCSFAREEISIPASELGDYAVEERLIGNYPEQAWGEQYTLRPFEAFAVKVR